jgi:hypothetical protein
MLEENLKLFMSSNSMDYCPCEDNSLSTGQTLTALYEKRWLVTVFKGGVGVNGVGLETVD